MATRTKPQNQPLMVPTLSPLCPIQFWGESSVGSKAARGLLRGDARTMLVKLCASRARRTRGSARRTPIGFYNHPGSTSSLNLLISGCSSSHRTSLSAYSLLRFLTHSALSGRCGFGSTPHCSGVPVPRFAASGLGGSDGSTCAGATDGLLAAKVSIAATRIPTAAATTLSSSAFTAMWMPCIAPTPASPTAKVTAPSGPTPAFQ
jgi:hypothetical protein